MPASKQGKLRPHRIDYIVLAEVRPGDKAPLHSVVFRTVTSKEAKEDLMFAYGGLDNTNILIIGSRRFYGKLTKRTPMYKLTPAQVKKAKMLILRQVFQAGPALGVLNSDGTITSVPTTGTTSSNTTTFSCSTGTVSSTVDSVGGALEVFCDCSQCVDEAPPSDTTEPYVRQPGDPQAVTPDTVEYDTDYNPYTAPEPPTLDEYAVEAREESNRSMQMLTGVMLTEAAILIGVGGYLLYHFGFFARLFHK